MIIGITFWATFSTTMCALSACVDVSGGGAAELAWTIRTPEGEQTNCVDSGIGQVRLCWQPTDSALVAPSCEESVVFNCSADSARTGFEVAPERTSFWIQPLCEATGEVPAPDTFEVPAPISRDVIQGKITTLNALLIVATNRQQCSGNDCTCP